MFLTKLAFKNLVRHRTRTLAVGLIIAFAVFFYIIFDSLMAGMNEMSYEALIDYETGHLQIVSKAYREEEEKLPLDNLISLDLLRGVNLEKLEGYRGSSVELSFQARLNNGINELPVVGRGVVPEELLKVFSLRDKFVEGEMFALGEHRVVMGKRLADLLQVGIGDFVILLVRDKNNTFNTIEAEISGLVHTINPSINNLLVYVPLDIAQEALAVGDGVSKVVVRLERKELAPEAQGQLESELRGLAGDLAVYKWSDVDALSFNEYAATENQVILGIILVVAAIAITNTVILAALERMREIGTMKAMGLDVWEIVYLFVMESTGIGILGGLMGLVMGAVGVWFLVRFGLDFTAMTQMDMTSFGVPVIGRFYGQWNPSAFITVFAFGVGVSLLSSILPGYWAAAKDPIQAIQHR
ncbi:MAG: ABC transporter permease [Firmicutes bacterium]|nr:ABC transporter permease [Bacillota bacterium]